MYEVIGIRNVDYESRKTNQRVVGVSVFCTFEDRNTQGKACESIYFSESKLRDMGWTPRLGDLFRPIYNKYGTVDSIDLE